MKKETRKKKKKTATAAAGHEADWKKLRAIASSIIDLQTYMRTSLFFSLPKSNEHKQKTATAGRQKASRQQQAEKNHSKTKT